MAEEKKGFIFPSAYTILFSLIIVVAIATWIVPAGSMRLMKQLNPSRAPTTRLNLIHKESSPMV